jgi:hypothetical protein
MKEHHDNPNRAPGAPLTTELLLLPDGRVLVHNLTPVFAGLLETLNPADIHITPRAGTTHTAPSPSRVPDHELP